MWWCLWWGESVGFNGVADRSGAGVSDCHCVGGDVVFGEYRDACGVEEILQSLEGWVLVMPGYIDVAFVVGWWWFGVFNLRMCPSKHTNFCVCPSKHAFEKENQCTRWKRFDSYQ